jgi:predicted alpha-1,6-mannanase (GH76 family)
MTRPRKNRLLAAACSVGATAVTLLATFTPAQASQGPVVTPRDRAANAITAMVGFYDPGTSRFDPGPSWWLTGNSLQILLDYVQKTGDRTYLPLAEHTVQALRAPVSWWPQGGGDFRTDSTDDTAWYGLAMVRLYQLTHDQQYLTIAEEDEAYIGSYWDDRCGGGVIWDIPSDSYKNAISNELYLELAASLHNVIPRDTHYLSDALREWDWFKNSGMINSDNLINDGLTDNCVNNGQTTWTYNQGVILGGLAQLYQATHNRALLVTARQIADAVISSPSLSPGGILTEPCEASGCGSDGPAFKGIFARNLAELENVLPGHPYQHWLAAQADSAYAFDRNASNQYGLHWAGPFDTADIGRQDSATSLLVAVLP